MSFNLTPGEREIVNVLREISLKLTHGSAVINLDNSEQREALSRALQELTGKRVTTKPSSDE